MKYVLSMLAFIVFFTGSMKVMLASGIVDIYGNFLVK